MGLGVIGVEIILKDIVHKLPFLKENLDYLLNSLQYITVRRRFRRQPFSDHFLNNYFSVISYI